MLHRFLKPYRRRKQKMATAAAKPAIITIITIPAVMPFPAKHQQNREKLLESHREGEI